MSPDYWSERSVVDVPAGRDVPPVDRSHHAVEDKRPDNDIFPSIFPIMIFVSHLVIVRSDPEPLRLTNSPSLWPVTCHVGENTGCVVRHLQSALVHYLFSLISFKWRRKEPQCHRCTSRGERRTLRQILGSSACAAVLAPVEEDCLAAVDYHVDDEEVILVMM